jgi:hypothetical protein
MPLNISVNLRAKVDKVYVSKKYGVGCWHIKAWAGNGIIPICDGVALVHAHRLYIHWAER